ncbi:hypothetical protein G7K_5446-t1 [Saitoella complicata NRRL Y-17804]|uniref:Uncharacterized protein n=1 Tax=Saitoella complicata (strain BCRC 22490 / CBS 7301 / JCM 7358 / NBRC 10748 / NRRL Y-17804) TaxID=698492 RepID=A0A0E9NNC4_SAICN|nr:hypothetical protein G7K_5446-t1 [Saitoella complicata NRRL Y-17804]
MLGKDRPFKNRDIVGEVHAAIPRETFGTTYAADQVLASLRRDHSLLHAIEKLMDSGQVAIKPRLSPESL